MRAERLDLEAVKEKHRCRGCEGKRSIRQGSWSQELIIWMRHNEDMYENLTTDEGLHTMLSLVSYIFISNVCIYLV